jgi:nucleotide-binding universal stress UspA family protein
MKNKSSRQSHRARVKAQSILVPIDFSDSSARALRHAAALVAECGGSLIVVHVVPADYGWLGIGRDESRELDQKLQRQAADSLSSFVDPFLRQNVTVDLQVRLGNPAQEIVAAAAESKSDLIVLSTHGLTGLDRYLIGSVADRVVRLASCPVLLIRSGTPLPGQSKSRASVLRFQYKAKRGR